MINSKNQVDEDMVSIAAQGLEQGWVTTLLHTPLCFMPPIPPQNADLPVQAAQLWRTATDPPSLPWTDFKSYGNWTEMAGPASYTFF